MRALQLRAGEHRISVRVASPHEIQIGDTMFAVERTGPDTYRVSAGGAHWDVVVAGLDDRVWVFVDGQAAPIDVDNDAPSAHRSPPRSRDRAGSDDLSSPMPATVVTILVEPGAQVARGDTLLMLEAMKMELPIRAPRDAVVARITCKAGDLVQPGTRLLELE
jgi:3-methylcrotonyl-CoA carboxylase alpha subunit